MSKSRRTSTDKTKSPFTLSASARPDVDLRISVGKHSLHQQLSTQPEIVGRSVRPHNPVPAPSNNRADRKGCVRLGVFGRDRREKLSPHPLHDWPRVKDVRGLAELADTTAAVRCN